MKHVTEWVHDGLEALLRPGDWAVDATLGNGHDAEVLARGVGTSGRVWGFDVQAAAIAMSRERLDSQPCFVALHASHARMSEHLPAEACGRLRAVVFNLGYLPGADHTITTQLESTLAALATSLEWLAPGGVLCCTCYPSHPGGREESQAVAEWFAAVPSSGAHVTRIERVGTPEQLPFVLWLERKGGDRRRAAHSARGPAGGE